MADFPSVGVYKEALAFVVPVTSFVPKYGDVVIMITNLVQAKPIPLPLRNKRVNL
jgi:hypothetical protein